MKKRNLAAMLTGALLFGYSTWALAVDETSTLSVSGTVVANCNLSTASLDFGSSIDVLSGANVETTATVAVTCTSGTAYDIGLDKGTHGTTVTDRKMKDAGTNNLNYQLFSNSGRTANWGETVETDTVEGTGNGVEQSLTVYARIPSGQATVPPGSYSDTVTVKVTY